MRERQVKWLYGFHTGNPGAVSVDVNGVRDNGSVVQVGTPRRPEVA
jgi:hypothetical protein